MRALFPQIVLLIRFAIVNVVDISETWKSRLVSFEISFDFVLTNPVFSKKKKLVDLATSLKISIVLALSEFTLNRIAFFIRYLYSFYCMFFFNSSCKNFIRSGL